MANQGRFLGQPTKNAHVGKIRVSYKDNEGDGPYEETEYMKLAKQIGADNKQFRDIAGGSSDEDVEFLGFAPGLHSSCHQKSGEIKKQIESLQLGLLRRAPQQGPSSALTDLYVQRLGNSSESRITNKTDGTSQLYRTRKVTVPGNVESLPRRIRKFSAKFLSNENQNVAQQIPRRYVSSAASNAPTEENQQLQIVSNAGMVVAAAAPAMNGNQDQSNLSKLEFEHQGKTMVPHDNANFWRIKSARMKQNSSNEFARRPPLVPFTDTPQIPSQSVKGFTNMPEIPEGAMRSGKFSLDMSEAEYTDDDSDSEEANGEILLDRQTSLVRGRAKGMIRALFNLDSEDVEQNGFPIVVDVKNGSFPPKPLCFLCGSAGIEQLIFCSTCCEPYHPFCSGDDSLLSSFVSRTTPKAGHSEGDFPLAIDEILKIPIPIYYNEGPRPLNSVNPLASLLSPPLTPKPILQLEKDLETEKEFELNEQLLTWKCSRCISCRICRLQNRNGNEKQNQFLKCTLCRLSCHVGCVKKSPKNVSLDKWICEDCFKCKSCGKKIDKRLGQDAENQNGSTNKLMLCLDCFRQRQKGSFCPICQVCYSDNDFETKMMECGKCERWVHAKCERLSNEEYQILSNLPESVEYICRLCDNSWDPFWRQAMRIEISNGCQSIFRIFQKKAVSMCRKKKKLNFAKEPEPELLQIEETEGTIVPSKEKPVNDLQISNPLPVKLPSLGVEVEPLPTKKVVKESVSDFKCPRVVLHDFMKSPQTVEQSSFILKCAGVEKLEDNRRPREATPEKELIRPIQALKQINSIIVPETPSPYKQITSFFDSVTTTLCSQERAISVLTTYATTMKSLDEIFAAEDPTRLDTLKEYFASSVREVFPWFDPSENDSQESVIFEDLSFYGSENFEIGRESTFDSASEKKKSCSPFSGMDAFQDMYWDPRHTDDHRHCSFCLGVGDFPPDFCGRLLWAGLTDWVHVNCALWSSEVWEENDGALQQVGTALNRSKTLLCGICNKAGASVSCCQTSCRNTYHFPCALNSDCALLDDKSIFCPKHTNKSIHDNIQSDMQVLRQVYVDVDWLRKKEKLVRSAALMVSIGSLMISRLGRIVPISVNSIDEIYNGSLPDDGNKYPSHILIPVGYECSRLFWSTESPTSKIIVSICSSVPKNWMNSETQKYNNQINLTIDHTKAENRVQKKLNDVKKFHEWIDTSPVYVDEYRTEWLPHCSLQLSVSSDEEETVEDAEVQTSFGTLAVLNNASKTLVDTLPDDPSPVDIFRDDANFFNDYLTPDAMAHLHSCVEDMIGDEWPELDTETCEIDYTINSKSQNYYKSKDLILDYHIIQVDGAYDVSSDDSSSGNESDDNSGSTSSSDTTAPEDEKSLPLRSKRARKNESPAEGSSHPRKYTKRGPPEIPKNAPKRLLRSRDKQPKLDDKKEEFDCSSCKKSFVSESSLNRHSKLCKPKAKPRKQKGKPTVPLSEEEISEPKRKRGRPRKIVAEISELKPVLPVKEPTASTSKKLKQKKLKPEPKTSPKVQVDAVAVATKSLENKSSPREEIVSKLQKLLNTSEKNSQIIENKATASLATSTPKKVEEKLENASDDTPTVPQQSASKTRKKQQVEMNLANGRVVCSKCKNVYRTVESLNKHMQNCYTLSSSDNDEDEDDPEPEIGSPVIVEQIATICKTNEESETESESTSEVSSTTTTTDDLENSAVAVKGQEMEIPNVFTPSKPEGLKPGDILPTGLRVISKDARSATSLELNSRNTEVATPSQINSIQPQSQSTPIPTNSPQQSYSQLLHLGTTVSPTSNLPSGIALPSLEPTNSPNSHAQVLQTDASVLLKTPAPTPLFSYAKGTFGNQQIMSQLPNPEQNQTEGSQKLQHIITHFQNNKDYTIQIKAHPLLENPVNHQGQTNSAVQVVQEQTLVNKSAVEALTNISAQGVNLRPEPSPSHHHQQSKLASTIPTVYHSGVSGPQLQHHLHHHELRPGQGQIQIQNSQGQHLDLNITGTHDQAIAHILHPGVRHAGFQNINRQPVFGFQANATQSQQQGSPSQLGTWNQLLPGYHHHQRLEGADSLNPQYPPNSETNSPLHHAHLRPQPMQTVTMQDANGQYLVQIPYPHPPHQQNQYFPYAPNQINPQNYHQLQQQLQLQMQQHQQQQDFAAATAMYQQMQQQVASLQLTHPHLQFGFPGARPEYNAENLYYHQGMVAQQAQHAQQQLAPQQPQGTPTENMTYVLVQPGDSIPNTPTKAGSQVCPHISPTSQAGHDLKVQSTPNTQPAMIPNLMSVISPAKVASHPQRHHQVQCTKATSESTEPGSPQPNLNVSSLTSGPGMPAKPCPCPDCHQPTVAPGIKNDKSLKMTAAAQKKLQKQLASTWGFAGGILPPLKKAKPPVKAKAQLASIMAERKGQGLLLYNSMMSPSALPKLLPATVVTTAVLTNTSTTSAVLSSATTTSDSINAPVMTPAGKPPASNPNIAVVRPMEHPLQKMSDQIQQIESSFHGAAQPVLPSTATSQPLPDAPITTQANVELNNEANIPKINTIGSSTLPCGTGLLESNSNVEDVVAGSGEHDSSAGLNNLLSNPPKNLIEDTSLKTANPTNTNPSTPAKEPKPQTQNVAGVEANKNNSAKGPNQGIKINLKRKGGEDSYSIDNITEPSSKIGPGAMRNLKIKGKITGGDMAGTSTDVVVVPVVHIVRNPSPESGESNRTIVEEEDSSTAQTGNLETATRIALPKITKGLTHRAVIVYEVNCNDTVVFRSSDVRAIWAHIFETVQGSSPGNRNLPPLAYPTTNLSFPDNKGEAATSFNHLGLIHRAVQFLLAQLPGANKAVNESLRYRFQDPTAAAAADTPLPINPSGCSRTEPYNGRKPFDMFGWLASKHRKPMVPTLNKYADIAKVADLPVAMKFRNLIKQGNKHLNVYWSKIHGRGLFTSKDIEDNEMIIEYAGEIIRSALSDVREKFYESKDIGCYMFRIDDHYVVDATLKGNAARFINHSCEPNCRSKNVEILGQKHILIFATRRISCGEELTYDYKFPYEKVKIPCYCTSAKCRKFLN